MKEPSVEFLSYLAAALRDAKHQNVAEHIAAGLLWAMYPEWFDANSPELCKTSDLLKKAYEYKFGTRGKR